MEMVAIPFPPDQFCERVGRFGSQNCSNRKSVILHIHQIAIQEFKVGLERDRLFVARQCFRGTLEVHQRIAAIAVRLSIVWLERDRLVVNCQRFLRDGSGPSAHCRDCCAPLHSLA